MLKGLFGQNSLSMIILKHSAKQIKGLIAAKALIVRFDEFGPRFCRVFSYHFVVIIVEFEVVFFEVLEKSLSSQDLADLDQLVSITVAHEEGLLFENLFLMKMIPLRRTWRQLTRHQGSNRSNCNLPRAQGP